MTEEAIEKLKNAICLIAGELDMDTEKARKYIKKFNKDELILRYIDLKDLRLKMENLSLVDLLIS